MELDNRAARPIETDQSQPWVIFGYAYGYGMLANLVLGILALAWAIPGPGGALSGILGLWLATTGALGLAFDLEAVRASRDLEQTQTDETDTPHYGTPPSAHVLQPQSYAEAKDWLKRDLDGAGDAGRVVVSTDALRILLDRSQEQMGTL